MKRLLGLALALGVLATGCSKVGGGGVDGRANAWTHPHVLTFSDAGDINTLNPHLGQFAAIGDLSSLTMAYLVKWDEHNRAYPELATVVPTKANGGVSADGLTITYHLRHDAKWSDGVPFTADDVVFSTHVVLNPANNEVNRQGWDQITKIDEPDKYTVVFHLKSPYSPFVETFFSTAGANPCLLPKHLLAKYPNINNVPYNNLPVGIGPFKYERWDRQQQVVLVANPLYFRGRPKLDKIIYKIVPDRNTLLSQLQAHELDMWNLVPGNYLARVKAIAGYTTVEIPSYYWDHLDLNLANPALRDPVVRRALRMGWNRAARLQKIGHGLGSLSDSPTPIGAPYEVKEPLVAYDPDKANAMLDADGWKRGPDGIRTKNGMRLDFRYAIYAGVPDVDNGIEMLRADWKKLGVTLEVKHYPTALYFAPIQEGGIVYSTKWDITSFAWLNDAIGDYSQLYACNAIPPKGQNDPRWCDPVADRAMHALYGHYEQPQRNSDVKVVVDRMYDQVPVIVQDQRMDVFAVNGDLKNFHPNAITPFDNFMDVDI
ncbi:MAG: peptide ABC transporter substrate-binding protein [bacterium]|nr:peptide ABC transporter substrate-binding protein [bacterium]